MGSFFVCPQFAPLRRSVFFNIHAISLISCFMLFPISLETFSSNTNIVLCHCDCSVGEYSTVRRNYDLRRHAWASDGVLVNAALISLSESISTCVVLGSGNGFNRFLGTLSMAGPGWRSS